MVQCDCDDLILAHFVGGDFAIIKPRNGGFAMLQTIIISLIISAIVSTMIGLLAMRIISYVVSNMILDMSRTITKICDEIKVEYNKEDVYQQDWLDRFMEDHVLK